jgi:hypothetical protein
LRIFLAKIRDTKLRRMAGYGGMPAILTTWEAGKGGSRFEARLTKQTKGLGYGSSVRELA